MSEFFPGVHFVQQKVTPVDDAIVWRRLFSDGKLTGCDFSIAGYTLTMTAGHIMVCGRQIRHTSVENWPVNGESSGFARLLLVIDLSRLATDDDFDQVNTLVEYADTLDGFPALLQEDINAAGYIYQLPLCVMALSEQGITEIVSRIGSA